MSIHNKVDQAPEANEEIPEAAVPVALDLENEFLAKLSKPELQLKLVNLQEANDWAKGLMSHNISKVIKAELATGRIFTLPSMYDVLSNVFLNCDEITLLTKLLYLGKTMTPSLS